MVVRLSTRRLARHVLPSPSDSETNRTTFWPSLKPRSRLVRRSRIASLCSESGIIPIKGRFVNVLRSERNSTFFLKICLIKITQRGMNTPNINIPSSTSIFWGLSLFLSIRVPSINLPLSVTLANSMAVSSRFWSMMRYTPCLISRWRPISVRTRSCWGALPTRPIYLLYSRSTLLRFMRIDWRSRFMAVWIIGWSSWILRVKRSTWGALSLILFRISLRWLTSSLCLAIKDALWVATALLSPLFEVTLLAPIDRGIIW